MKEKMNYGIIGVGAVFEVFQINSLLRTPGLNLLAICDINEDRLQMIKGKYGIPRAYTNYKDLLKDEEIEVVMINLPQHIHKEAAVESAKAGKHIYVEKPIASTLSDARIIIESAQESGVKLCVGHQRRFITTEMKAKELIEKGWIGDIFKIRVSACWFEPRQNLLSKSWWYKKEYGGGPLMRWGVHKMDSIRYLLKKEPERVYAEEGQLVHRGDSITVEDNLIAVFRFENGMIGELEVSNSQHEWGMKGEYIEIWGEKGTIRYWPSEGEMQIYTPGRETPLPDSYQKLLIKPDGKEMIRIHEKFIESIQKNTSPPVTGEDGYKALEMVLASYLSAEERRVVTLPLGE